MKLGTRQHESASLKLSYCQGVPAHMRGGIVEITSLNTPEEDRGKGFGSELLRQVCDEADAAGKVLVLMPDASNLKQLAEWYARFGFSAIQVKPVLMARRPGAYAVKIKPLAHAMGMH